MIKIGMMIGGWYELLDKIDALHLAGKIFIAETIKGFRRVEREAFSNMTEHYPIFM